MEFDPATHPHRRFNPLIDEYVLVSPHRTKRPWLGQTEPPQPIDLPQHDPACYLCPGNTRSGGKKNPEYRSVYSFENDFAALLPSPTPSPPVPIHPLLKTEVEHGACDVLMYHPRHDLSLSRLSLQDIEQIIEKWIEIYQIRGSQDGIKYVQIFENKGSIMGCSNPHPHGQIWSTSTIPTIPAKEMASLQRYSISPSNDSDAPKGPKGRPCLLCEYAHLEIASATRAVVQNEHWVVIVPWWAVWPFEVLVLPFRRHVSSISQLSPPEKVSLADILSKITKRYDNLFSCSFAYSMGIHQRPVPTSVPGSVSDNDDVAHLHIHFTPPLLRSASVRKFLVGFELMAEAQRDLTPEQAAEKLRACAEVHYLDPEI